MQFKITNGFAGKQKLPIVIMRTFILLLCATVFGFTPDNGFSQDANIIIKSDKSIAVEAIFALIQQQTNYTFVYRDGVLKNAPKILLKKGTIKASVLLKKGLSPINYIYTFDNNTIVVTKKTQPKPTVQKTFIIKGIVKDEKGDPILGATVYVTATSKKGKTLKKGTVTDFDGKFKLTVSLNLNLVISAIGHQTYTQKITTRQKNYTIILKDAVNKIEDVVVTGIVTRKKESFTGAAQTFTGKQLKSIGNVNVIQSIKTLDPSFIVVENNTFGSDPNNLPNIHIRGKTGLSLNTLKDEFGGSPNQPLFILDGFPTSLQTVVDLDMNRVASMTLLKDAASTALYGADAANGVVVIETIRPKAGKLQISYNYDVHIHMPDLSDYNLMNATQKLEYEKLSGVWDEFFASNTERKFKRDKQYNAILAETKQGVNSYWLGEPVREGITIGHSLRASGGNKVVRYGVGLNLENLQGVMKGSERKTWGANIDLSYRKGKLNISNSLYIDGAEGDNSPYGQFSTYATTNPYFRKTDADGNITKYLDIDNYFEKNGKTKDSSPIRGNPLYNASLKNIDNTKGFNLRNNVQAIWRYNTKFKVTTNFQLQKGISTQTRFISPKNTQFIKKPILQKGSYSNTRSDNSSYNLNMMVTYATVIKEKHQITANIRGEVQETEDKSLTFNAEGFPAGTDGDPTFSFGYRKDSKPYSLQRLYRRVNLLASLNYAFDRTYLFDATYRVDGSTVFGSNKKYSPFWSVGAGVNINRLFDMDPDKVTLLKIRGNMGVTGNQKFGSLASTSVYRYDANINVFGKSLNLQALANPDLQWQNTLDLSIGLDVVLFKNRASLTLNAYRKKTDPLIIQVAPPPSIGVRQYPLNRGYMHTKGIEAILRFSPIYKLQDQITWTLGLTASADKSKYGGFGGVSSLLKFELLHSYKDGGSPDDLWTVPSLGIDPGNGEEVFLTKEGLPTYDYNIRDERRMGTSHPQIQGILSSNLRLKNFTMGLYIRYRFGRDLLNRPLFYKVENIVLGERDLNYDLRVLTERWKKPGDISKFKSIRPKLDWLGYEIQNPSNISSRFLQKENVIVGESINFGYEFRDRPWMKKIGISRLNLKAFMNDIFHISSIKTERGIYYPFQRSVSFSINANF